MFVIYGCNDSFLERQPLDQISDASFWNTENDLMVYNHSFYDMTKDDNTYPFLMGHDDGFDSHRISYLHYDGMSDNTSPRHGRHSSYAQIRAGVYNIPSSVGANAPAGWYGYKGFQLVRAINIGLANYTYNQNKKLHKFLTRSAFLNLGHPFQPFILGQKNLAPKPSPTPTSSIFTGRFKNFLIQ